MSSVFSSSPQLLTCFSWFKSQGSARREKRDGGCVPERSQLGTESSLYAANSCWQAPISRHLNGELSKKMRAAEKRIGGESPSRFENCKQNVWQNYSIRFMLGSTDKRFSINLHLSA